MARINFGGFDYLDPAVYFGDFIQVPQHDVSSEIGPEVGLPSLAEEDRYLFDKGKEGGRTGRGEREGERGRELTRRQFWSQSEVDQARGHARDVLEHARGGVCKREEGEMTKGGKSGRFGGVSARDMNLAMESDGGDEGQGDGDEEKSSRNVGDDRECL